MSFRTSLVLGHPNTPGHEAAAAAVLRVLEANDVEAETVAAEPALLAAELIAGRIDLLCTAFLPELDRDWLDPAAADPLSGVLYRPRLVCAAVASPGLSSLADLRASSPELPRRVVAEHRFEALLRSALDGSGLLAAGWQLDLVDAETAYGRLSAALDGGSPAIHALCLPHPLAREEGLRVLEDPDAALPGPQEARLVLRRGVRAELDPDLIDELEALTLGNPVMAAMELGMRRNGMTAADAAEAWQRGKLTPRG
ncbi:MAG: glycine betaine ABC transporter substrate-binding protein [Gluconacetobacter diazotrophicus]|nr:glycine betaine ABC transporter substrate-binding protein [Gluconacetobacter diazotrophicus]